MAKKILRALLWLIGVCFSVIAVMAQVPPETAMANLGGWFGYLSGLQSLLGGLQSLVDPVAATWLLSIASVVLAALSFYAALGLKKQQRSALARHEKALQNLKAAVADVEKRPI